MDNDKLNLKDEIWSEIIQLEKELEINQVDSNETIRLKQAINLARGKLIVHDFVYEKLTSDLAAILLLLQMVTDKKSCTHYVRNELNRAISEELTIRLREYEQKINQIKIGWDEEWTNIPF